MKDEWFILSLTPLIKQNRTVGNSQTCIFNVTLPLVIQSVRMHRALPPELPILCEYRCHTALKRFCQTKIVPQPTS